MSTVADPPEGAGNSDQTPGKHCLRLLIADDSDSDRLLLKTLLKRLGHEVRAAANGSEAVAIFGDYRPDMVLLDVMMPVMDGMDAARRIKSLAGEALIPVIFLTSLSDAEALARCLDAGGDDFLTKPYNKVILQAKLQAFNRMRLMHQTLSHQRDLIRERNRQLLEEQQQAKRVFDNIAHTGCLDAPNIRHHVSPMSIFNGDILFACPRPAGGMHVLIGDFTGHGLPAAIGALPIAEMFYGMTSMGFSGSDVLREVNDKLGRILPTGMFCCAALIQADFDLNQLRIWNGGLPDGVLFRKGGERVALVSRHLPLGVLNSARFDPSMELFHTREGDQLLLMTDGVQEATDSNGNFFGEARLNQVLDSISDQDSPLERVLESVRQFTGEQSGQDDLTLVSLQMVVGSDFLETANRLHQSVLKGPEDWHCVYEVRDETLRQFSPLPLLLHICMEVPGLRRKSADIYTLLSELYNNALEHGVLDLSSELKTSSEGFSYYYSERERRLSGVSGHFIRFALTHTSTEGGGQLRIVCQDSGKGFDHGQTLAESAPGGPYSGRGLMLMQRIGHSLSYSEQGSRATLVYDWEYSEVVSKDGTPFNNPGVGDE